MRDILNKLQSIDDIEMDEAPLPPEWDKEVFKPDWNKGVKTPNQVYKERIKYAVERAQKLGKGSSRTAFDIEYEGRATVLKVAHNAKGMAQNAAEASVLNDGYIESIGIVIPLIDYDEEHNPPVWIHTEKATKATQKQLCSIMKCGTLENLITLVKINVGELMYSYTRTLDEIRQQYKLSDDDVETLEEYVNLVSDLSTGKKDLLLADFTLPGNWGLYNGNPVIVDVGFTTGVRQAHYFRENRDNKMRDILDKLEKIQLTESIQLDEKSVSKNQQQFMGMVHAAQKGEKPASKEVAKVAKSMKKKDVTDFAKTKHKGLPTKVETTKHIPDEDEMADEELSMFSRHNVGTRRGRGQGDNPWNKLHKHGRGMKGRTRKDVKEEDVSEECAAVGTITKQNTTKDVNKKTPQKNLDAFNLEEALIDMYNSLMEGGIHRLSKEAQNSIKGAVTTPDANNNAGDAYKSYRFGLALAGAPDYPTKAVNDIGGDPLLTTYTDEEMKMVQYAGKQVGVGQIKRLTSNRSKERDDTNTQSAISPAKKNKYGV
jgi:hypothetical protein